MVSKMVEMTGVEPVSKCGFTKGGYSLGCLVSHILETAILDVRSRAEILLPAPARDGRWLESVFCFGRRPADTARSGRPRQPGV